MRGNGVHANGGVTNQRKSCREKFLRVHANQRIGEALAGEFHVTVSIAKSILNVFAELLVVHSHDRIALIHRGRDDDG